MQWDGKIQGRLATELDDNAHGFFLFDNVQHIFLGQRLEIEFVGGIVIRAYGFRVAVHHDALDALVP